MKINKVTELIQMLSTKKHICLYGAGFYLNEFLREVKAINPDYLCNIEYIAVSDIKNNPDKVSNIPVLNWKDIELSEEYYVLLTLGNRFFNEVSSMLYSTGAQVVQLDFDMFQEKPYNDIYERIYSFIESFPQNISALNEPDFDRGGGKTEHGPAGGREKRMRLI